MAGDREPRDQRLDEVAPGIGRRFGRAGRVHERECIRRQQAQVGLQIRAIPPRPILEKLNAEVNKLLNSSEVRENWAKQGTTTMGMSVDEFGTFLREEIVKWAKVVKASGAKVD